MEDAVRELRGEVVEETIEPEIQIGASVYIPDTYMEDVNQRLVWYKRLAALRESGDRGVLAEELEDRYGPIPPIVDSLLDVMELRRRMKDMSVSEARLRGDTLSLRLHEGSSIDRDALIDLVKQSRGEWEASPGNVLRHQVLGLSSPVAELEAALLRLDALPRQDKAPTARGSA